MSKSHDSPAAHSPREMDPFHQTVVMPSVVSEQDRKSPFVALIEGSGPDFSQEVNSLLRDRLRIVAILLFVSHLAFLLKAILLPSPDPIWEERLLFWTHAATTALVGIVALRLCTGCQIMLRHLRFAEFLIFGSSAAFFLLFEWNHLQTGIRQGFVPSLVPPWLILIFTYALLVPNSWRRALAVILPMALAPAAVLAYGWFAIPEMTAVRERLGHSQYVMLETLMVMATGATVAVWGVRTIRSLRTAAFQARQLGQYRLRRMLGRGGMGEVYLAEHLMLKRPCAIKLIRPGQTSQEDTLARFEREVQSTAKLSHWNTVEIFDYGHTSDGTFYYVMEYLPGLNLDQIVSMHGPLPPERVIFLLRQVCEALTEAHEQGLVHRDIKPANIFAAKRGGRWDVAKLLDFGLVRAERNRGEMNLTQIGMVTGSPLYMSPEQALGEPVDARSDLYSLGCVAYYLLSGRPPFEAQNPIKVIMSHAQHQVPSLTERNPLLPGDLVSVVMKCLEKDPADRFRSADSVRQALDECQDAGRWNYGKAEFWWSQFGCPKKRALDDCVLAGRVWEEDQNAAALETLLGEPFPVH